MNRRLFHALLVLVALACVPALAENEPAPKADETGMVPGDLVLGNMSSFPGHAGIYLGKWKNLPVALREKYAEAFEQCVIYSYDEGLKDSFLVVDSYAPRVAVRSFAEQFTEFFTGHGSRALHPTGALKFEGDKGAAIEWTDPTHWNQKRQSLPLDDPRRWRVVEEALKCAVAKVKYGSDFVAEVFPAQWAKTLARKDQVKYEEMTMDCITMAHVVYWKGAGINLQPKVASATGEKPMPLAWPLLPLAIDATAEQKFMKRAVLLEPVYREAVFSGKWKGEISTEWDGKPVRSAMAFRMIPHLEDFRLVALDPESGELAPMPDKRQKELKELVFRCSYDKANKDVLILSGGDDKSTMYFKYVASDKVDFSVVLNGTGKTAMTGVLTKVRKKEVPQKAR
ncbi:MAG: hypothetical protein KIS92_05795 [Planctomycetota bacterium]|nr:hypothetical protein [Planctomycetota bacterium]